MQQTLQEDIPMPTPAQTPKKEIFAADTSKRTPLG